MVPRTQEPPQNLTALTGHQNSTFFVVLLLCLGMCACACRTCQLRLGTRFTLGLSPSTESELRRSGSPTGSLGFAFIDWEPRFGGSPIGSLASLPCGRSCTLYPRASPPDRMAIDALRALCLRALHMACLLGCCRGCRHPPNPVGCPPRHLLHFSHTTLLLPPPCSAGSGVAEVSDPLRRVALRFPSDLPGSPHGFSKLCVT